MTEIVTRAEAIARGLTRYFTGKPCNRGHVAERYVVNWRCLQCLDDYQQQNHYDNSLKRKYGLSRAAYEDLVKKQGNKCAICGSSTRGSKKRFWSVDHCHKTNRVRGLLCSDCNLMLGYAKDNSSLLRRAIGYLERATFLKEVA